MECVWYDISDGVVRQLHVGFVIARRRRERCEENETSCSGCHVGRYFFLKKCVNRGKEKNRRQKVHGWDVVVRIQGPAKPRRGRTRHDGTRAA